MNEFFYEAHYRIQTPEGTRFESRKFRVEAEDDWTARGIAMDMAREATPEGFNGPVGVYAILRVEFDG